MIGRIVKGIAGFYYVHDEYKKIYECRAKGIFRNQKLKPLVGDEVEITILDDEKCIGNLIDIKTRQNEMIRPQVANVDQAIILFAAANPEPNLNLLDRFLLMMQVQKIPTIICFNKKDLVQQEIMDHLTDIYTASGCQVLWISVKHNESIQKLWELLDHKTTVLAGPSGVGKSSLVNLLQPMADMETGAISEKIKRGKHTTRHSELVFLKENTYLMDTPGFSSLSLPSLEVKELGSMFVEFLPYENQCRFIGCLHKNEPQCAVKDAVEDGEISSMRYQNYLLFLEELKQEKRY